MFDQDLSMLDFANRPRWSNTGAYAGYFAITRTTWRVQCFTTPQRMQMGNPWDNVGAFLAA